MFLQKNLGILPALPDSFVIEGEPGSALLDDLLLRRQVDEVSHPGNALAVHDVELHLFKGRGHFILYHLDLGPVSDDILPILDGSDPPDIQAKRGVEF